MLLYEKSTPSVPEYSWHLSRHVVLDDKLLFGYQLLFYWKVDAIGVSR